MPSDYKLSPSDSEEFLWTEKGTLYSKEYDDVYFADGKGTDETEYVFLEGSGFAEKLNELKMGEQLSIAEFGFGTGLNFLTTWKAFRQLAKEGQRLCFSSFELHLLTPELLKESLKDYPELAELAPDLIAQLPRVTNGVHQLLFDEGRVELHLHLGDAAESLKAIDCQFDIFFLDGFTPSKNPALWSDEIFKQMARHSKKGTSFSTYTAVGAIRRSLKSFGFEVERIKGFAFKRHMMRGTYRGFDEPPSLTKPYLRLPKNPAPQKPKIAIVGAGLAGSNLARVLSREEAEIHLFDKAETIASAASGNPQGMLMPLLSKKVDPLGLLCKQGFRHAYNTLQNLDLPKEEGILELCINKERVSRLNSAIERFHPDYAEMLSADEIKEQFSFDFGVDGVLHKTACSLSPKMYCQKNIEASKVELHLSTEVKALEKDGEGWLLKLATGENFTADIVILANAGAAKQFSQTAELPIRWARGQLLEIPKKFLNVDQSVTLNFKNYLILNEAEDYAVLGASFQIDDLEKQARDEDRDFLIASLREKCPGLLKEDIDFKLCRDRVAFRAVMPDHYPIVGPAPKKDFYDEHYGDLRHGKPLNRYPDAEYHQGLYLSVAHGSRGLMSTSLSAEILSAEIFGRKVPADRSLLSHFHPARVWLRNYRKH